MFVLPICPAIASNNGKDIDASSLGDSSLKMALQSAFEAAAVELDSFLAEISTESSRPNGVAEGDDDSSFESEEQRLKASKAVLQRALCLAEESESSEQKDDDDDNNSSFASEERRLQASEVVLRRALECIDCKDETDSLPSFGCPRDSCTESFDSPENQVPLLQPVSPFGSPCSSTEYKEEIAVAPFQYHVSVFPPKIQKRRQLRAYGLRPHNPTEDDKSIVDFEAPTKSHTEMVHIVANVLFGRNEYSLHPLLSKRQYKRTVQGTVSVLLASGIVVADLAKDSPHFLVFIWLVPALIAFLQANLPHRTDESFLAMLLLGTHTVLSHLCAR
jgi:hypothetical protein